MTTAGDGGERHDRARAARGPSRPRCVVVPYGGGGLMTRDRERREGPAARRPRLLGRAGDRRPRGGLARGRGARRGRLRALVRGRRRQPVRHPGRVGAGLEAARRRLPGAARRDRRGDPPDRRAHPRDRGGRRRARRRRGTGRQGRRRQDRLHRLRREHRSARPRPDPRRRDPVRLGQAAGGGHGSGSTPVAATSTTTGRPCACAPAGPATDVSPPAPAGQSEIATLSGSSAKNSTTSPARALLRPATRCPGRGRTLRS